jgi:hypothetical protein
MIALILIAAGIATAPVPGDAAGNEATPISLESRALLRCAAAFALIANDQEGGIENARNWPELGDRGREFFVRALAQVMDQTGFDREGIARAAGAEAEEIRRSGNLDKIMPACLVMLEESGT